MTRTAISIVTEWSAFGHMYRLRGEIASDERGFRPGISAIEPIPWADGRGEPLGPLPIIASTPSKRVVKKLRASGCGWRRLGFTAASRFAGRLRRSSPSRSWISSIPGLRRVEPEMAERTPR